ncbi:hypothetical protein QCA50_013558 [Cerrena zonata]|uniref:Uncharacterized protein n=1 Tax=Cerrena zonata TaxID=2478898 RepID=A0AAW0G0Y9_9APHY
MYPSNNPTPPQFQVIIETLNELATKMVAIQQDATVAGSVLNNYPWFHTCSNVFGTIAKNIQGLGQNAQEAIQFFLRNIFGQMSGQTLSVDKKRVALAAFRTEINTRVHRLTEPGVNLRNFKANFTNLINNGVETTFNLTAIVIQLSTVEGVLPWIKGAYDKIIGVLDAIEQQLGQPESEVTAAAFEEDIKWMVAVAADINGSNQA